MPENIRVINGAGYVAKAALRWTDASGNTQESSNDTGELGLGGYAILKPEPVPQQGADCWMVMYVRSGPTHESGDNFEFKSDGLQVAYTMSGSVFNPSWSKDSELFQSWED